MCILVECSPGTVKQLRVLCPKSTLPPSRHPALRQKDEQKAIESKDDDMGAAVDLCGFMATVYEGIYIWVRIDQFQDVQPLFVTLTLCAAELKVCFRHHSLD